MAERVPVVEWVQEPRFKDEWLKAFILRFVGDSSSFWNTVVATALYGRLISGEPEERHRILQAIELGRVDWQVARPRRWFSTLTAEEVERVEGLALAELDMLEEEIVNFNDLDSTLQPAELIKICHRRDDLQAVRVLLQLRRPDGVVAYVLDDFDSHVEEFDDMTVFELPFDERLRRMAQFGIDSWWTQPARSMKEERRC